MPSTIRSLRLTAVLNTELQVEKMGIPDFYSHKNFITDLGNILSDSYYEKVPDDWYIILTDIKGSTKAIERGLYKQVNMVGVASIVAVKNACGSFEIPFIFGGDGATMFVPPHLVEACKRALSTTKKLSATEFELELRAAFIPARDISALGGILEVAKFKLSEKSKIAMLRGSGINTAEELAKKTDSYELKSTDSMVDCHTGMECRWEPIQSSYGEIITLIIKTKKSDDFGEYYEILKKIRTISPQLCLVTPKNLSAKFPPTHLIEELRLKFSGFKFYVVLALVLLKMYLLSIVITKTRHKPGSSVANYIDELSQNTDYIKYDDCLRMVLDVSAQQSRDILICLEGRKQEGKILFGYHISKEALMTCFVQQDSNHIHFVDGGAGGYTLAAKMLKASVAK